MKCFVSFKKDVVQPVWWRGMNGKELAEWEPVQEEGQQLAGEAVGEHCRVVVAVHLQEQIIIFSIKSFLFHCHEHNCHHQTPARTYWQVTTYMIYHVVMTEDIISLMILFSISPQCLYHSGRERLFDIGQRQNRLNCSTSTWKYWNIEISCCVFRCFRISKLLFLCCSFSILPNDVYVCTGLGSGLANTDMLETKTKALRGWESIGRYHKNIWYFDKF